MTSRIRLFLLVELIVFIFAVLVHFGVLVDGHEHNEARIAESVIAVVLLGGLVLTWIRPAVSRGIGLAAQGFGLLGTLVGVFTIIIDVGPRTGLDITLHIIMLALFLAGIWAILQSGRQVVV